MNPTKAAAILSLIVAVAALGYAGYQYYENAVMLRDALHAIRNEDFDGPLLEYWVPLGISVVALIASLALFGAAKPRT
ncbi:MAG: hypothetical protein WAL56_05500 [Candidatus Sulfotelmatobacter sp.]